MGELSATPYFMTDRATLWLGDALEVLSNMEDAFVDCVVTSPPYYGQRDYGVEGQLGLEADPLDYIAKLVTIFDEVKRVLKPTGSVWVNIGDTYWSGKGSPTGPDLKQKNRRFDRPQDKRSAHRWAVSKQLVLIPHRFAIAMQDAGWIVRNDNVWNKIAPFPDPVDDRCAVNHEYIFHFVKSRRYTFDMKAVAVPTKEGKTQPPPSVWSMQPERGPSTHPAVFPEKLVELPIKSTCPPNGVLLDPFCGSGTALAYTLRLGHERKCIGIDLSKDALEEARAKLEATPFEFLLTQNTHQETA